MSIGESTQHGSLNETVQSITEDMLPGRILGNSTSFSGQMHTEKICNKTNLTKTELIGSLFIEDATVRDDVSPDPDETARFHHQLVKAMRRLLDYAANHAVPVRILQISAIVEKNRFERPARHRTAN